jgi:TolB protein
MNRSASRLVLAVLGTFAVIASSTVVAAQDTATTPDSAATTPAPAAAGPEPVRILWADGVENAYPRWSKDGKRILFQSNRGGKWQLYVMDADGANERRITDGDHNENFPDWSPDNEWIAFVSDRDGNEEVYVMRADGTEQRNLSRHPGRDIHPYWAPNGKKLLFNSTRDAKHFQIYSVHTDGTNLERLSTSDDDHTCARLSPDGRRMVYLANLTMGQDDVIVADSLAQKPANVTNDAAADGWPVWTPDGSRIVYASGQGSFSLFSMNPNGSDRRRLTSPRPPFTDARPSVSPDGRRIVFNRAQGKTIGIYVLELHSPG